MTLAICDDEDAFRQGIGESVLSFFGKLDTACREYGDGARLLAAYEAGERWDAIFLDIEMERMGGLEAAARLRRMGCDAPVIFLTGHPEYAMDGYEVSAFRFLAKPLDPEKLRLALADLREALLGGRKIAVRADGEEVVLSVDEIRYIEAANNSVRIALTDGEYLVRGKLSEMEARLGEVTDAFVRIHRSYLVHLGCVRKIHGHTALVTGGEELPISRPLLGPFRERLLDYVRRSAR